MTATINPGWCEALEELVNVHPRRVKNVPNTLRWARGYDRHAEHKERVDDTLRDHCAEALGKDAVVMQEGAGKSCNFVDAKITKSHHRC